jgi:hypothetical protein
LSVTYKMGISVLHPAGFVETGGCSGPRLIRNQPSRETPGVIMSDLSDKYVTQFTVPYRNAVRSLKDFKMNWALISPEEKKQIIQMVEPFSDSKTISAAKGALKSGGSGGSGSPGGPAGALSSSNSDLHVDDISELLNSIVNPNDNIKKIYSTNELVEMRSDLESWVQKRVWYYPFILIIMIIVFIICYMYK